MKLTNAFRENFVKRVMDELPIKHPWDDDEASEKAEAIAHSILPADVKRFLKKYPGGVAASPACYDLIKTGDPLCSSRHYADRVRYGRPVMINEAEIDFTPLINAIRAHRQEEIERESYRRRLTQVVGRCFTLKTLQEALPQLVHLMSNSPQIASQSPDTLVADLAKAGLKLPKKAAAK